MAQQELSPKQVQEYAHKGVERLKNFRQSRLMFLRNYVGQYYDSDHGPVGSEPLNLVFNAIRTLLPTLVMNNPKHNVHSRFLAYEPYAELLSLALSQHDKDIDITDVYTRCLVDAIFTLGIMKTGLAESGSVMTFEDGDQVDVGDIYTEVVDFDNLIVDPRSKQHLFKDAQFIGDVSCVPRQQLLDSGLYDPKLVEALPRAGQKNGKDKKADTLSRAAIKSYNVYDLQDEVEIAELWFPGVNIVATIPGSKDVRFKEYLRVEDFYGPDDGPYTFLALTPPVPGNPLPVPSVGVWNDLHVLANRMAKKIVDQAERQKDIVGYKRSAADDAQSALDAADGDAVAMDDPSGIAVHSFGGQQNSNEAQLGNLQGWFNMMAGNPITMSGQQMDASSATEARILNGNASVGLQYMAGLLYRASAQEGKKRAWYMHTDPFIHLPLVSRQEIPAQYVMSPNGPVVSQPAQQANVQIYLTPEARKGDFLDYNFDIEPESMGFKDANTRYQQAMEFAVKILPATFQAAVAAAQLGIAFSPKKFLIMMAHDRGIDWMDEVFYDPEFQAQMTMQMLRMPSPQGSRGIPMSVPNAGAGLGATLQNGQPGQVGKVMDAMQQANQQSQGGANFDQSQSRQGAY